jgi:hypothetical protein
MSKLNDAQIQKILGQDERDNVDVSLEDINSFGNRESLKDMFTDIAKYNKMLQERIVFCNESLTAAIPFTRENLYLICAYSGSGKSSMSANISWPLWKQSKKTLIISNEESKQDVLFRIACLELGFNFNSYKKGHMPIEQQKQAVQLFPEISKYVKIFDVNYKNGLTTKLEGIKNALEKIKDEDFSCAMIDYYQLVKYSIYNKQASTYEVLDDLRIWLGQYIKRSRVPVVVFAQLHSLGKRNMKDLDGRIKACPTIYETATCVLELIPNFEEQTSDLIIHKDRFGLAGFKIICGFDRGRFVNYTDDFKRMVLDKKLRELQKQANIRNEAALDV